LCVGALLLASHLCDSKSGVIFQKRSFFGVLKIYEWSGSLEDPVDGSKRMVEYHQLVHGTTTHGTEIVNSDVWEDVGRPISYYHEAGPIGDVFAQLGKPREKSGYAVVGLGTGTLAAYAANGQKVTYYEIDPLVKGIAENRKYFTFVQDARERGVEIDIVMGDARVQLERRKNDRYGMIFVDAFSSDSIPVHLLTREAMRLYFDRLEPDGILVVHISNRHLDLRPVVAKLAQESQLSSWLCEDGKDESINKDPSNWVVVGRAIDLGGLPNLLNAPSKRFDAQVGAVGGGSTSTLLRARWVQMTANPDDSLWEDDYSNLLKILSWR
jgi:hypothetical protein